MPADVAEDSLDLMIELLEATDPSAASYPFPTLRRTGMRERRTFRAILLENPHFRATVVPELGGRIVRWEDKRVGRDLWEFNHETTLSDGGRRGASWPTGLQIRTGFDDRLNAMGTVANAPDYGLEGESPTGLWLGELCGEGIGLNWRYTVPEDQPYLELEVRAFNRTLEPLPYNGGIFLGEGDWVRMEDDWAWRGRGGSIVASQTHFSYSEGSGVYRFDRVRYLAPRQLDSWTVRIYPSGIGQMIRAANESLHVGWSTEELRVQGVEKISGAKVVVRTAAGQTMELPAELSPNLLLSIPLDTLDSEITELVVLDSSRRERIRASQPPSLGAGSRMPDDPRPKSLSLNASDSELWEAEFEIAHRHLAHLIRGYRCMANRDFAGAAHCFEQSLLFNAEDHLAWWAKAAAERLAETQADEHQELANAHFLAPLEPLLRAESFLASPVQTRDKSAVLSPLAETPEAFVDVASLLLEAGLAGESARWLAEALLHVDLPALRYLLADLYLRLGGMDVEAAEQVQLAVRDKPEPPYPWRQPELDALGRLRERFPADGSLRRLSELVDRARPTD